MNRVKWGRLCVYLTPYAMLAGLLGSLKDYFWNTNRAIALVCGTTQYLLFSLFVFLVLLITGTIRPSGPNIQK